MAEFQVPKLIDQSIVDILMLAIGNQLRDLFFNGLIIFLGVVEVEKTVILAMNAVQVEDILVILLIPRVYLIGLELLLEVVVEIVELARRGIAWWYEDSLLLLYVVLNADVDDHRAKD